MFAAALVGGACMGDACEDVMELVREARSRFFGPLHPGFRLVPKIRERLREILPPDCYLRCTNKLYVSLTRVWYVQNWPFCDFTWVILNDVIIESITETGQFSDGKNFLASEFDSNEELIDAIICSCFIPFYCGFVPPTYRWNIT